MIPKYFVTLQENGFRCVNYYTGEGGRRIGITTEHLRELGFVDDSMFVHPAMIPDLQKVEAHLHTLGYGLIFKDAFRSVAMYKLIVKLREERHLPVASLFNTETMPHSTGLAIDAVLFDLKTGQEIKLRNHQDGIVACKVNFYRNSTCEEDRKLNELQWILIHAFKQFGFALGTRMEYWHFNHSSLDDLSTRYWEPAAEW